MNGCFKNCVIAGLAVAVLILLGILIFGSCTPLSICMRPSEENGIEAAISYEQ